MAPREGRARPRPPRRLRKRVHRHLFRVPAEGLLIGAWGFERRRSPNRYEEEA